MATRRIEYLHQVCSSLTAGKGGAAPSMDLLMKLRTPAARRLRQAIRNAQAMAKERHQLSPTLATEYMEASEHFNAVERIHNKHEAKAYAWMRAVLQARNTCLDSASSSEAMFVRMKFRQISKRHPQCLLPLPEVGLQQQPLWSEDMEPFGVNLYDQAALAHEVILNFRRGQDGYQQLVRLDTTPAFSGIPFASHLELCASRMAMWGAIEEEEQLGYVDTAVALLTTLHKLTTDSKLLKMASQDEMLKFLNLHSGSLTPTLKVLLANLEARVPAACNALLDPRALVLGASFEGALFLERLNQKQTSLVATRRWMDCVMGHISAPLRQAVCRGEHLACKQAHAMAIVCTVMYTQFRRIRAEVLQYDVIRMEHLCVRMYAAVGQSCRAGVGNSAVCSKLLLKTLVDAALHHHSAKNECALTADVVALVQHNAVVHWPVYAWLLPLVASSIPH